VQPTSQAKPGFFPQETGRHKVSILKMVRHTSRTSHW
jgi:hypothetical protein